MKNVPRPRTHSVPSNWLAETVAAARPTEAGRKCCAASHQKTTPSADVMSVVSTNALALETTTPGPLRTRSHPMRTARAVGPLPVPTITSSPITALTSGQRVRGLGDRRRPGRRRDTAALHTLRSCSPEASNPRPTRLTDSAPGSRHVSPGLPTRFEGGSLLDPIRDCGRQIESCCSGQTYSASPRARYSLAE